MPQRRSSNSFVLRIWREGNSQLKWRGKIQHARTGKMVYVQNLQEMLAFIQRYTGQLVGPSDRTPG